VLTRAAPHTRAPHRRRRTHNASGTPASAVGTHATLLKNSVLVMTAGLILLDVANMALVLMLAADAHDDGTRDGAAAGVALADVAAPPAAVEEGGKEAQAAPAAAEEAV
jgi:hypothetical protein